uniref:Transmembrane protein 110, like n=1 Tax=Gallus gallus TaxID=9031 RepID=A0A8V0XFU6_CHICK
MAATRPTHGCGSGALLGCFGVLLQALLALCVFCTLMLKRFKEPKEERRPWRIWFYDTSKQAIGALFIHFANIFLSERTEKDPCSLYLINFILDATLGMLLIWLGVKVVSWAVQRQKYTYLVFGEYGDPPQAAAWISQCILYLLIMVVEKTLINLVLLIPGWTELGSRSQEQSYQLLSQLQQILLSYIPNPQLELFLVMLVVPFIVNAVMFWVVDSLIMRKYKQKDTLNINGSTETPQARRSEESQMLWLEDVSSGWFCLHRVNAPGWWQPLSSELPLGSFKSEVLLILQELLTVHGTGALTL